MNFTVSHRRASDRKAQLAFKTIKVQALRLYLAALTAEEAFQKAHGLGGSPSFRAIEDFARSVAASQGASNEFLLLSEAILVSTEDDWIQARWWRLSALLRDSGSLRIHRWDIRRVVDLIHHFPACAPVSMRAGNLACHIDDATGEWMLSAAKSRTKLAERQTDRGS